MCTSSMARVLGEERNDGEWKLILLLRQIPPPLGNQDSPSGEPDWRFYASSILRM